MFLLVHSSSYLFINDATTPATLTLPLHDALPIWARRGRLRARRGGAGSWARHEHDGGPLRKPDRTSRNRGFSTTASKRSEEHTSELQSRGHLVCRLLLEKKKQENIAT